MTFYVERVTPEESARRQENGKRRDIAGSRPAYLTALNAYCAFRAAGG